MNKIATKKIYPSLHAAPDQALEEIIVQLTPYAGGFHYDIIDSQFAKNSTTNNYAAAIKNIKTLCAIRTSPLWIHAMVIEPSKLFKQLTLSAGDIFTWHIEQHTDQKLPEKLRLQKISTSLAINPHTPLGEILPFVDLIDQILIMGVKPGRSGQTLIPKTRERIAHLDQIRKEHNHRFTIGVDGGITIKNLPQLITAGADQFVVGSEIFNSPESTWVEKLVELQALTERF